MSTNKTQVANALADVPRDEPDVLCRNCGAHIDIDLVEYISNGDSYQHATSSGCIAELHYQLKSILEKVNTAEAPALIDVNMPMPGFFLEYVERNYPPRTIISDPKWHAPKLWRAALSALRHATSSCSASVEGTVTLHAYRFTIRREYHGVIAAESLHEAEAALEACNIDDIDCAGGEAEYVVKEANRSELESAEANEVLFDVHGASVDADDVVPFFDDDIQMAGEVPNVA